jgi:hypothetical protein
MVFYSKTVAHRSSLNSPYSACTLFWDGEMRNTLPNLPAAIFGILYFPDSQPKANNVIVYFKCLSSYILL